MKLSFVSQWVLICSGLLVSCEILAVDQPQKTTNQHNSEETIRKLDERIRVLEYKEAKNRISKVVDPVLALPQINLRSKYDTAPIYNQDQAMLTMRKNYERQIRSRRIDPIPMPRIEIGGNVIGLVMNNIAPKVEPLNGFTQNDLQLSGANLNISTEILQSTMAAIRISYNPNSPLRISKSSVLTRVENSNIYLNTGFLTFGDLEQFPMYLTIGQIFLPFGEYASGLATSILPARLGRFRTRPVLIGFKEPGTDAGWDVEVFAFRGDSVGNSKIGKEFTPALDNNVQYPYVTWTGGNSGILNNGGVNIGYKGKMQRVNFGLGASYVLNIADSGGMQNTGVSTIVTNGGESIDNSFLDEEDLDELSTSTLSNFLFPGFGGADFNKLAHGVPAIDLRAKFGFDGLPLSFMGELVTTTRAFDAYNLSYNTNVSSLTTIKTQIDPDTGDQYEFEYIPLSKLIGARVSSWHVEGTYKFDVYEIPSSITFGGGASSQALALNIPQSMLGGTLRFNFKKYVSLALSYMYSRAYPDDSYGTGETINTVANKFVGTNQKTLTAQITGRF